jgi:hypothetical protein
MFVAALDILDRLNSDICMHCDENKAILTSTCCHKTRFCAACLTKKVNCVQEDCDWNSNKTYIAFEI